MKKILFYISIFFGIGTIITIGGLVFLDRFIYSLSNTDINITQDVPKEEVNKIKLEDGIKDVSYSYDNKYYTYLKDSKLYVNNLSDGSNLVTIEETDPICYSKILYDKNIIIYFTQKKIQNKSAITLRTYEIDTQRKSKYNEFDIANFSNIKDMDMSPLTNLIYINIETKSGKVTNNLIYRINLLNTASIVKSGSLFNQMFITQYSDKVYYEDEKYNIYQGSSKLSIFKEKVEMIGVDSTDKLYFISKENKNIIYVVKDNSVVSKIKLEDTDVVKTYANNQGVYLIYKNYVIDVSSKEPLKKIAKLSEYVSFEAIRNGYMYLRTSDNLLIKTNI